MFFTKILLAALFLSIPFIHWKLLPTLWIDIFFEVSWNYEFTKALFFNILSGIIFISFVLESFFTKTRIHIPLFTFYALVFLILSTVFSLSPFTSIIWDVEKAHTSLLFLNVLWLFLVLKNTPKKVLKKLILLSLISWACASLLAIKELIFPSFEYAELSSRALWSFWHPNYIAWYLLILLPLTTYLANRAFKLVFLALFITTIILTKSVVAVFLGAIYLVYMFFPKIFGKKLFYIAVWIISLIWLGLLSIYFPEKVHSFLSRFYLWETTLKIILSDTKILLIGWGAETLPYLFDSFKVPELYIFENFGYTADRPHNFLLNIFFHFWVFALVTCLYLILVFWKSCNSIRLLPQKISLMLFLILGIFHFFSIAAYILVVLLIASVWNSSIKGKETKYGLLVMLWISIFSLIGGYYSFRFYQAEILYAKRDYIQAQKTFEHPNYLIEQWEYFSANKLEWLASQYNLRSQIIMEEQKTWLCKELISSFPSVENYFYCWKVLEAFWEANTALEYYTVWLTKVPDLWNVESPYWERYFIQHTITGNRFFSSKFSDISSILTKVEDK